MNYPDKFKATSANYEWDITKVGEDRWEWVEVKSRYGYVGEYSAERMDNMHNTGIQFIFPEPEMVVTKERSLVFPFTFKHAGVEYSVKEGDNGNIIVSNGNWLAADFPEDSLKHFIKEGSWVVTSVGEQKAPETPTTTVSTLNVEFTTSGVDEATEAFKRLAEAVENVNIALESFQKLKGELFV